MSQRRTEMELRDYINLNQIQPGDPHRIARHKRRTVELAERELATVEVLPKKQFIPVFYAILCLSALIMNEVYLLKDGLMPYAESAFAIGQWGSWIGVAFALIAAFVVRRRQPAFLARRKFLDQEQAAREHLWDLRYGRIGAPYSPGDWPPQGATLSAEASRQVRRARANTR